MITIEGDIIVLSSQQEILQCQITSYEYISREK